MWFSKRNKTLELPELITVENPVNYNSVLDYLVGLSEEDYGKIGEVSRIYRQANRDTAEVLGVEDKPTTHLIEKPLTEEEAEAKLDSVLDEIGYIESDAPVVEELPKPRKQAAKKKITVSDESLAGS